MKNKSQIARRPITRNIAFFGDSNVTEKDVEYNDAYEIAKELASQGYTIVNGGGPGIMYASTLGAQKAGGETISVTFTPNNAPGFEGRYLKNVTDKEIKTQNYIERMFKLLEHADFFIVFKGGSGTLSEWATAWVLAKLYFGHHKPFILFGKHWIPIIDTVRRNMNIDRQELAVFDICTKKEDVLPKIIWFDKKLVNHDHSKDCAVCADASFRK